MSMSDKRVLELIETWGADPVAWPEDERAAGEARLAEAPERFADARAEARVLDLAFEALPVETPPADLAARILAEAPAATGNERHRAPRRGWRERLGEILMPGGARWPAGAVAASLLVGLSTGPAIAGLGAARTDAQADEMVYAALGYGSEQTWTEGLDQ